jgi:hypothetical protein
VIDDYVLNDGFAYRLVIWCVNGAGLMSSTVTSPTIIIDNTIPLTGAIQWVELSSSSLCVSWQAIVDHDTMSLSTFFDHESGLHSFDWSMTSYVNHTDQLQNRTVFDWTRIGLNRSSCYTFNNDDIQAMVTSNMSLSQYYQVNIRVWNQAGLYSTTTSVPLAIDPNIGDIDMSGAWIYDFAVNPFFDIDNLYQPLYLSASWGNFSFMNYGSVSHLLTYQW